MDIETHSHSGILAALQLHSFEELADIAVGWNADFKQLDTEQHRPDLFQAQIGSILVSGARFGCHVYQQGGTPEGMRTFAIPDTSCTEMRWFGHITEPDVLLCFPAHGDIDVYSRPGFSVATFSIPEVLLADFLERNGGYKLEKILGSSEKLIRVPRVFLNNLRTLYQQLQNMGASQVAPQQLPIAYLEVEEQVLNTLLKIFESIDPVRSFAVSHSKHKLNQILEYINANTYTNTEKKLRISELCVIGQVSERTLQGLFKRELGMTPKAFLKGQKMYKVHRELWRANPAIFNVSNIANRYGFTHLGQFATDYRRMFGELPSTTLNRSD